MQVRNRGSEMFESRVEVLVMAASAGGFKALSQILSVLPADFPEPVVIVYQDNPIERKRYD